MSFTNAHGLDQKHYSCGLLACYTERLTKRSALQQCRQLERTVQKEALAARFSKQLEHRDRVFSASCTGSSSWSPSVLHIDSYRSKTTASSGNLTSTLLIPSNSLPNCNFFYDFAHISSACLYLSKKNRKQMAMVCSRNERRPRNARRRSNDRLIFNRPSRTQRG